MNVMIVDRFSRSKMGIDLFCRDDLIFQQWKWICFSSTIRNAGHDVNA